MARRSFKSKRRRRSSSTTSTTIPDEGDHHHHHHDDEGNGGVNNNTVKSKSNRQQQHQHQPPSSLEDDLRQQRLRQQFKREKDVQDRAAAAIVLNADTFTDAASRDAGGGGGVVRDNDYSQSPPVEISDTIYTQQRLASCGIVPLTLKTASLARLRELDTSIRLPSSLVLGYVQESTPIWSPCCRGRIRQLFQTKYLLEGMVINARASALYGGKKQQLKWVDHTLPDGLHCSWDLTCKYHLHPSARTMDVAMVGTDLHPTIATTIQGGWAVFRPPTTTTTTRTTTTGRHGDEWNNNNVHTMRDAPVQAIRLHGESGLCGTVLRPANGLNWTYQFKIFSLSRGTVYFGTNVDLPIHDFCFGTDLVLFSCPRYHSGSEILPLFLPLQRGVGMDSDGGSSIRKLNVRNFPQSDALRVEMSCDQNNKIVAFGHRNGQTSLLDLRTSNVCTVIQYDGPMQGPTAGMPLGSVSDMTFLSTRPSTQILIKRSFGSFQLHDLRKTTSSSSSSSSTTVIYNMTIPPQKLNATLSSNCNGFTLDQCGEQTLLSPYVNQSNDACLGTWSLQTGLMVGSRVLLPNTPDRQTSYVELCKNQVPAFSSSSSSSAAAAAAASSSSTLGTNNKGESDAWAAWFKCGAYTKGKISSKVGSLHEMSFPGRWK
jgi:hypothetical protein